MAERKILYVPILKSKAGERWALSHLTPARKAKVRPLLEFHPPGAKSLGEHVESICESLQAAWGVDRLDLLLDYRQHAMTLANHVPNIPHLADWRLFIAASGVFPVSLVSLPLHQWTEIPRYDWASWQNAVEHGLQRDPIFSDYTMRPPGAPADFGAPSVNLRYTLEDHWRVQMGGRFSEGASPQIHAMCAQLVASPEYSGVEFSTGDEEIDRVSDDDEGPGGPTQWLQWCVSHHIEFVVEQLEHDGA